MHFSYSSALQIATVLNYEVAPNMPLEDPMLLLHEKDFDSHMYFHFLLSRQFTQFPTALLSTDSFIGAITLDGRCDYSMLFKAFKLLSSASIPRFKVMSEQSQHVADSAARRSNISLFFFLFRTSNDGTFNKLVIWQSLWKSPTWHQSPFVLSLATLKATSSALLRYYWEIFSLSINF